MPSPTVEEVETRLETVQCAICKGSSFGVDRRFMQTDGEWRGICKKCHYSFPIYTDMEFYHAHTTGYPLPAQGDVLSDLQSPRREPQFSCHHVRPGIHLFPDLYGLPENLPGAFLPGSL